MRRHLAHRSHGISTWLVILLVLAGTMLVVAITAFLLWRRATKRTRDLAKRVQRLPLRAKLRLAKALMEDQRIPRRARLIPAAFVLYLAMPLDLVPDFIPVLGQLDDVLVLAVGVALLARL